MAISLLPTEGDDGLRPEREAQPRRCLQSAVEQVAPAHLDVGLYISNKVFLSEQAQDVVQLEFDLHIRV